MIVPPTVRIQLFGGFDLSYGGTSLTGAISERLQSLLAYLLLHRDASQSRQHLAFLFWPDSPDSQARTNLRRVIHELRQVFPTVEQFIAIDPKTLQWRSDAPFTLDVMEFEQASAAGDRMSLQRAADLYRGKLLPNCYDEWIEPEQERLQQACIGVYGKLMQVLLAQQDYSAAIHYGQQLLRIDPLNEAGYADLMRAYALSGDRANALQVYHRCMRQLREELGVDPSPITRKLYEKLLLEDKSQDELPAPHLEPQSSVHLPEKLLPSRSLLPMVGRQTEWQWMQTWFSTDPKQVGSYTTPQVLLLTGEPGIGKTRLLEELQTAVPLAQPPPRGIMLWGRGFAAEMVRPYGIWIDALRSVELPKNIPSALGLLLPEMEQPIQALPDRSHLFDAVVQLLSEWATQAPLLILLDDIQWIDEASSALLHYASRLLSQFPVKFACTARSGELSVNTAISQVLQALRREQRLKTIELAPFDRGDISELMQTVNRSHAFDLSVELVDQVFTDSGGNPLFVLEIARALSQNLLQSPTHPMANLAELIGDRLQQLDDATRDLLPWAAALGRSFRPMVVAQVADCPLTQLLTAIAQLEQHSIIRPSRTVGNEMGYDFVHDIVRQVVYQQISEPRRHLVHLQIAHKLQQIPTSDNTLAGDIAHHAALGGDHALAAKNALQGAHRCLKLFAYAEASVLAERGVQSCQFLDQRSRIHFQLALLQVWALSGVTGDRAIQMQAEVRQLMAVANQLGLIDDEAIGLETLNILYYEQGNYVELHHNSLRSAELSQAASPAAAARALGLSGSCLAELGRDLIRAEALLLEAQSLANRVGCEHCDIYGGLGMIALHKANYDEARTLLQKAWRLAQCVQDGWRECNSLTAVIMTELEAGDPFAALSYCETMKNLVAQLEGKESEGAVVEALMALAYYQLRHPNSAVNLETAIVKLKQVDIKRVLAYVLIGAAEVDFAQQQFELAAVRAESALQAAQIMQHPSEIALAWTILIQSLLASGEEQQASSQFKALQGDIDRRLLSVRAQTQVDLMMQQLQPLMKNL
jgi:DNA-binding SARP family transcriptional activator